MEAFATIHVSDPYMVVGDSGKAASDKLDGASDVSTCTAGFSSEERLAMEARCNKLLDQAGKLTEFLKERDSTILALRAQLEQEREKSKSLEARVSEAPDAVEKAPKFEDLDDKQKEAARAKLRRFCQRKADGSLLVPLETHNQWKDAGAGREKLLQMFVSVNFDRDPRCANMQVVILPPCNQP